MQAITALSVSLYKIPTIMAEVTKRATKKALAEFCDANNVDAIKVSTMFHSIYPNEYIESDEIAPIIIKHLFKNYDTITDNEIRSSIKELESSNKFYHYKLENIERFEKEKALTNLLEKIIADAEKGDVRASQYPEWNKDMKDFIKAQYGHWSIYDDRGKIAYGKAFYSFFSYWYFGRNNPPFHCYATNDGDILFTKQRHKWIESKGCYDFETSSNSGCMVVIVAVIVSSLLTLL